MVAAILRQVVGMEDEAGAGNPMVPLFRAQIVRALGEGRWRFADHFCDKLLAEEPGNLEALLLKGHLAWCHFHDTGAALNHFRKVITLGGFESSNEYVARAQSSLARLLEQLS